MAIHQSPRPKPKRKSESQRFIVTTLILTSVALLFLLSYFNFIVRFSSSAPKSLQNLSSRSGVVPPAQPGTYLYWGHRIDCPGKHCESCEGLGHQESSLRCALEEAMFLGRTFIIPSRMCINPIHNKKKMFHLSNNSSSEERWEKSSCAMDSLYDIDLISKTVPVVLHNSKIWHGILSKSKKLGIRGIADVRGTRRSELKESGEFSNSLLINRSASPLSWFMECGDRNNHSAVILPYSFLPSMAARKLRDAASKIKLDLGDYDAIHVRRGDKLKTRKDRFGVHRSLHPHLDRDTRPESILRRISKWVPLGRMLFIGSNERTPGFFSPLSVRYRLAYSWNYSGIIDPVVENNYQLFIIERLIMAGAKTFIRTFKEDDDDLSLTDDPKKNTKSWQIPLYDDVFASQERPS